MKNTYFMAKKIMSEQQFSEFIYKLVKESIDALGGFMPQESESEDSDDNRGNETEKEKKIRMSVEKQLQRPGIDIAPYAYSLDGISLQPANGDDNEHKNARSKLYKKINHKPDSNGEPQYLSPEETIKLKNELSGNLSEGKKIKLSESDIMHMVNESIKRILKETKNSFEAAKYQGKWSVFDKDSKTFSHIGVGKRNASKKAKELNDYCEKKDKEEKTSK